VYNNTSSFISLYQARREGEGVEGKLTWAPQRLGSLFRRWEICSTPECAILKRKIQKISLWGAPRASFPGSRAPLSLESLALRHVCVCVFVSVYRQWWLFAVVSGSGRVSGSRVQSQLPVRLRRQPDLPVDDLRERLPGSSHQHADRLSDVLPLPAGSVVALLLVWLRGTADWDWVEGQVLRRRRLAVRSRRRSQPAVQRLVVPALLWVNLFVYHDHNNLW